MERIENPYNETNRTKFVRSKKVVCVDSMATVSDAAKLMRENHIGDIVVVDRRNGTTVPLGILTDRDITIETCAQNVATDKLLVSDIMTKPVDVAHETDDVFELVRKMKDLGVCRLPIVDKNGSLVSLVSANDIFKVLAQSLSELAALTDTQHTKERELRH